MNAALGRHAEGVGGADDAVGDEVEAVDDAVDAQAVSLHRPAQLRETTQRWQLIDQQPTTSLNKGDEALFVAGEGDAGLDLGAPALAFFEVETPIAAPPFESATAETREVHSHAGQLFEVRQVRQEAIRPAHEQGPDFLVTSPQLGDPGIDHHRRQTAQVVAGPAAHNLGDLERQKEPMGLGQRLA